jgi:hypothetical protein
MTGDTLMRCLIVFYVVLAGVYLMEGNYMKAWYWLGAAQISASVVMMQ